VGAVDLSHILDKLMADLRSALKALKWNVHAVHLKTCKYIPFPKAPQAITAMLEELAKGIIIPMLERNYDCEIELPDHSRQYPDITVKIGNYMFAIDIKTTRLEDRNRVSGFTLGPYTGYFLHPNASHRRIKYPYARYDEHIIVGIIYDWDEKAPTEEMVRVIDIIVHPKWKIASRVTGTGTTRHIRSITNLDRLRRGQGDFNSREEFERYWRKRGREFEEQRRRRSRRRITRR